MDYIYLLYWLNHKCQKSFLNGSYAIDSILGQLSEFGNSRYLTDLINAGKKVSAAIVSIAHDLDAIKKTVSSIGTDGILEDMFNSLFYNLNRSSRELDSSLDNFSHTINKLRNVSDQSGEKFEDFRLGFNKFSNSSASMTKMIESIKDLLDSLASMPDIDKQGFPFHSNKTLEAWEVNLLGLKNKK